MTKPPTLVCNTTHMSWPVDAYVAQCAVFTMIVVVMSYWYMTGGDRGGVA